MLNKKKVFPENSTLTSAQCPMSWYFIDIFNHYIRKTGTEKYENIYRRVRFFFYSRLFVVVVVGNNVGFWRVCNGINIGRDALLIHSFSLKIFCK